MEFRDLKSQYRTLKTEIDNAISQTLVSGTFILGNTVTSLEEKLAEYVGVKHCISCANATDALTMSLMAFGVGERDAVFVPGFTYIATASSVAILKATPVFVDIDPTTFNMCPSALEAAIQGVINEGKVVPKVIIPVDLYGLPADYPAIETIAEKYNLKVLEDGAQGFGGKIGSKRACSFGDVAVTSFFPAKPLGCYGDGGAVFTNNDNIRDYLKMLRVNGASPTDKYNNRIVGLNSRLDAIQAAILHVKLSAFESYEVESVNRIATWYTERLHHIVQVPEIRQGWYSSYAQYSIRFGDSDKRDYVRNALSKNNIPSMIYYPIPLNKQHAFSYLNQYSGCPVSEYTSERILSIPMHPYLTLKDVEDVCNCICAAVQHSSVC
ncbi:MAG: DegT/DnrJ/EryC1/StrS family aminotransferase [Defluviitaleaceae bacterium]|nr:DegT/DnrJ/EryC1/StrS family aminotransferase [Defluviitaleaceae bacterium]